MTTWQHENDYRKVVQTDERTKFYTADGKHILLTSVQSVTTLFFPLAARSPKWYLPSGFPTKYFTHSSLQALCIILIFDLVAGQYLVKYKLRGSICNILCSPWNYSFCYLTANFVPSDLLSIHSMVPAGKFGQLSPLCGLINSRLDICRTHWKRNRPFANPIFIQDNSNKDKIHPCSERDSNDDSSVRAVDQHAASYATNIPHVPSSTSHIQRNPPISETLWNFVTC
jgi:hypothetical protein